MAVVRSYVEPVSLYRYRSLKKFERELEAIEEAYLYCAPFSVLNDPMEGAFTSSRRLRNAPEYDELRRAVLDNKDGLRICSFSEVPDHELMWAHYADQFKGICISYSLAKLMENMDNDVSFVRMFYSEKQPTIHKANRDYAYLAKMVLSYKNYKWLYEREWRMFATLNRVHYQDVNCVRSVRSVRLGARMPVNLRKQLSRTLNKLGIPVTCMSIRKYQISFDPIE
jgi:hypothetical protein